MALIEESLPTLNFARVRINTSGFSTRILNRIHAAGVTIGHYIFVTPQYSNFKSLQSLAVIAHELKHVEQVERLGFIHNALSYTREFALHGFKYSMDLPLEKEAYDFERIIIKRYIQLSNDLARTRR